MEESFHESQLETTVVFEDSISKLFSKIIATIFRRVESDEVAIQCAREHILGELNKEFIWEGIKQEFLTSSQNNKEEIYSTYVSLFEMVGIDKTGYASTYKALDELYDLCSKSKEEGTLLRQTELESALLMAIGNSENNTCVITRSQPSQKEETPANYIIALLNHADLDSIIDNINFYAMQKEISDFVTLRSVIIYLMESQLIVEKIDKLKLIFNLDENLHAYVSLFETLGRLILSLYRHAVEEIDAAKTLLIDSPSEAFPTIPTDLVEFAFNTILEQYSTNPTSTYTIPMSLGSIGKLFD